MLYVESDGTIRLTRGDTARLTVDVVNDQSGESYFPASNEKLTLTIKKSAKTADILVQKTIEGGTGFYLEPSDTKDLAYGKYKYDVQLQTANNEIYTIVEPSEFEIMPEVTW